MTLSEDNVTGLNARSDTRENNRSIVSHSDQTTHMCYVGGGDHCCVRSPAFNCGSIGTQDDVHSALYPEPGNGAYETWAKTKDVRLNKARVYDRDTRQCQD